MPRRGAGRSTRASMRDSRLSGAGESGETRLQYVNPAGIEGCMPPRLETRCRAARRLVPPRSAPVNAANSNTANPIRPGPYLQRAQRRRRAIIRAAPGQVASKRHDALPMRRRLVTRLPSTAPIDASPCAAENGFSRVSARASGRTILRRALRCRRRCRAVQAFRRFDSAASATLSVNGFASGDYRAVRSDSGHLRGGHPTSISIGLAVQPRRIPIAS